MDDIPLRDILAAIQVMLIYLIMALIDSNAGPPTRVTRMLQTIKVRGDDL